MTSVPRDFVDLHIHGAFGVDFVSATRADLDRVRAQLATRGYAGFLPTLVPLAGDEFFRVAERLAEWVRDCAAAPKDARATPLGLHFEGPFVSPARSGALHPDAFRSARDARFARRFVDLVANAPGRTLVTLAPEIDGGLDLVRELARAGARVAIGHTDADVAVLERAVDAGARHVTHLCNAMRPLHHREPGPIGFALACDRLTVDVIADGVHVHPKMIELIYRAKGAERVALISDAMPAAGLGDGEYSVWGESLVVKDGAARNAAGNLAGSVVLLDECVANVAAFGIAPAAAAASASVVARGVLEGVSATGAA